MKAYKIELVVVDFEDMGIEDIKNVLRNSRYIHPNIIKCVAADIGEWEDDHPLNKQGTTYEQVQEIFSKSVDKV